MESQEIISSMVKSRECCRRLVQSYETERNRRQAAPAAAPASVPMLQSANQAATQILTHLATLPRQPCATMNDETRAYSSKILTDIRGLLEKAIMLEREMRTTATSHPHTGSQEEL